MKNRRGLLVSLFLLAVVALAAFVAVSRFLTAPAATSAQQATFHKMQLLGLLRADWYRAGGTLSETEARRAAGRDSAVHLLFLGVDRRKNERGRSDAIHLLRLAPGQLTLFSIPRDSLINIHGDSRPDKINHCYAYGGHALVVRKVEDLLDITIDGYLEVDLQTFVHVAQFAKTVTFNGRLIGAEDIFSRIDGLLSWLRNRSIPGGDVRRVARQQLFIAKSLDWTLSLYREHPHVLQNTVVSMLKILPSDITVDQVMALCQIYSDEALVLGQTAGDTRPQWSVARNPAIARMERYVLPGTSLLVDARNGAVLQLDSASMRAALHGAPLVLTRSETGAEIARARTRLSETDVIGPTEIGRPGAQPRIGLAPSTLADAGNGEDTTGALSIYKLEDETRLKPLLNRWRHQGLRMNYEDRDELLK